MSLLFFLWFGGRGPIFNSNRGSGRRFNGRIGIRVLDCNFFFMIRGRLGLLVCVMNSGRMGLYGQVESFENDYAISDHRGIFDRLLVDEFLNCCFGRILLLDFSSESHSDDLIEKMNWFGSWSNNDFIRKRIWAPFIYFDFWTRTWADYDLNRACELFHIKFVESIFSIGPDLCFNILGFEDWAGYILRS